MGIILNNDKKDILLVGVPVEQVGFIKELFKNFNFNINIKELENRTDTQEIKEKNLSYQEAKEEYLSKYRGSFTGGLNAEKEYNQHRVDKYGK
ncbi:MAG: hypothetical protein RBQ81_05090 [Arcobacteraceae bacterium]|jgi:hypothetical protein|nr:hypothetical protein [Arcobacteraceae bacterium]MDY0365217.1 hypothetical protein [Arcobacteraceae bacterium]